MSNPSSELNPLKRYEAVYALVRQIPAGQVATYGQIAECLGLYGQARQVGYALFRVPVESDIPWHRVINAQGKISESPQRQGGDVLQKIRLEQEGVEFDPQGRIDLQRHRWRPPSR
ncbi:MAG: MGMT family protein [Thermosynechococcaceae cyanobacterium]